MPETESIEIMLMRAALETSLPPRLEIIANLMRKAEMETRLESVDLTEAE